MASYIHIYIYTYIPIYIYTYIHVVVPVVMLLLVLPLVMVMIILTVVMLVGAYKYLWWPVDSQYLTCDWWKSCGQGNVHRLVTHVLITAIQHIFIFLWSFMGVTEKGGVWNAAPLSPNFTILSSCKPVEAFAIGFTGEVVSLTHITVASDCGFCSVLSCKCQNNNNK